MKGRCFGGMNRYIRKMYAWDVYNYRTAHGKTEESGRIWAPYEEKK